MRWTLLLFAIATSAFGQTNITGIWGTEQRFGPRVTGTLIIDGRRDPWSAQIAGFSAAIERNGDSLRFSLPDDQGEFRGHVRNGAIAGEWIQPVGAVHFQRYATPVNLAASGERVWRGDVKPLDDTISFYVAIDAQSDGSLAATVANPEFNWLGRQPYTVTINGSAIALHSKNGEITGTYDAATDQLRLAVLDDHPPLAFTRRSNASAVGFLPRAGDARYAYRAPIHLQDGWSTASLDDVGIDHAAIDRWMHSIIDANVRDPHTMRVHAILIARHGKLALEEYFYGFTAGRPHDTRSAGKTFAPLLAAIAGVDPSTPVAKMFPGANPKITLRDLMTMTPGFACDDNDPKSPGNENVMQAQSAQPDWYAYAVALPQVREPGGSVAIYCSAGLNLVGGVAQKASKTWLPELFQERIARPLQFGEYHINLMPTRDAYMGGGVYLQPRDALKLGQLYLSGGVWHGERIVSQEWVDASTATHSKFANPLVETDLDHQYGYGWHIHHFTVGGHVYREYAAEGNGGQLVMVIPDLDMVVAVFGGNYGTGDWYRWTLDVLPNTIIPAARP